MAGIRSLHSRKLTRAASKVVLVLMKKLAVVACCVLSSSILALDADAPVVSVDGVIIAERELEYAVRRTEASGADRDAVVEQLITQHLTVAEAQRQKLDQDPAVVTALAAARDAILVRAYLATQLQQIAKPSTAEVKAYYEAHHELFSKRAVYKLQEINIEATGADLRKVSAYSDRSRTLSQLTQWLLDQDLPFNSNETITAAEDLAADLLEPVSKLVAGQVIHVTTDRGMAVVQLTGKREEPLSLADARPKIEEFLRSQALNEHIEATVAELREAAEIEYYPPYAAPK